MKFTVYPSHDGGSRVSRERTNKVHKPNNLFERNVREQLDWDPILDDTSVLSTSLTGCSVRLKEISMFEPRSPSAQSVLYKPLADLDIDNAVPLRRLLSELRGPGHDVVIDLGRVGFIDAMALGVLAGSLRQIRAAGGTVRICNADPHLRWMLELVGLDLRGGSSTAEASTGAPSRRRRRQLLLGRRHHRPPGRRPRGAGRATGEARPCPQSIAEPSIPISGRTWFEGPTGHREIESFSDIRAHQGGIGTGRPPRCDG
jgi:anti-anti-sigma factor